VLVESDEQITDDKAMRLADTHQCIWLTGDIFMLDIASFLAFEVFLDGNRDVLA